MMLNSIILAGQWDDDKPENAVTIRNTATGKKEAAITAKNGPQKALVDIKGLADIDKVPCASPAAPRYLCT